MAWAVVLAAVIGAAVGALARAWIGALRRGAVVRPGWIEIPVAVASAVGVLLAEPSQQPLVLWIGLLGVVLTAIDIAHHRLPDAITLPAVPITVLVTVATALGWPGSGSWLRAVLGGAVLGGAFYLLALAAPKGMGRGDAKLAVTLGIALGYLSWAHLLLGVFLGFFLGAVTAAIGIALRRWTLSSAIPFGPALLLGTWLVLAVPWANRLVGRSG